MALEIVIADRGWVWIGQTERDGDDLIIRDAKNIERWGTSKGLGQLALDGPQAQTRMRDVGTVRVNYRAVIGRIACEAQKWR